ncbi:MAG: hypothetical protein Q9227_001930 [Pyrenula ochraceoflavens]
MLATLGQPIPANTAHAVSVSLPSWKSTVGYEEGEDWVLSKMKTGYPRFFVHHDIQKLEKEILRLFSPAPETEKVILFPSHRIAQRCQEFFFHTVPSLAVDQVRILDLIPAPHQSNMDLGDIGSLTVTSSLSCVFYPAAHAAVSKQVWQHSGDGVSSRRAEYCFKALQEGLLHANGKPVRPTIQCSRSGKGPRRYQKEVLPPDTNSHRQMDTTEDQAIDMGADSKEHAQYIEERFGRNLNAIQASKAKLAIKRRIAGTLTEDQDLDLALETPDQGTRRVKGLTEDDIYLFPSGMSAIFNTHRMLLASHEPRKSICFGFPYIDTLKILQKWGPGCLFYGNGLDSDLDDLETRLQNGARYLALFTEFPSNPLLRSPNLHRIRALADKYSFAVIVDESVGNFINVQVLSHADVVVSSLTKIFSGDSNVMGGSAVLNPHSPRYQSLKQAFDSEYEDNYWAEDALFMERNSRDFLSRIERINANAEAVTQILAAPAPHANAVKQVYYPKLNPSRCYYDACRNPNGGYGGLFSVTFHRAEDAVKFFDTLDVAKGPSLGTNFTLSCPYTILAHYGELEWAASFGVEADLVRVSVGLEDRGELEAKVRRALEAVEAVENKI